MPFIAKHGYEVVLYDQRGAGKTSPGKLYALTNDKYVIEDLDSLVEKVKDQYPGEKMFLVGHSMVSYYYYYTLLLPLLITNHLYIYKRVEESL